MEIIFTSRSSRGRLNSFKCERQKFVESGFNFRSSPKPYNVVLFTNPTTPSFELLSNLGSSAINGVPSKTNSCILEITPLSILKLKP
ncbi:hypothetical protein TSUD_263720 [Trifolium subterraneum]|uniref:Uncharacterized protein n=1 Tax=Trifolium subterraneum TaxID=3900 RepID=A0A2Z6NWN0_TRISU|nr:hypothetical protein TSUD_263720 [Trifolium subterraneum]